eukprot:g1132.t1
MEFRGTRMNAGGSDNSSPPASAVQAVFDDMYLDLMRKMTPSGGSRKRRKSSGSDRKQSRSGGKAGRSGRASAGKAKGAAAAKQGKKRSSAAAADGGGKSKRKNCHSSDSAPTCARALEENKDDSTGAPDPYDVDDERSNCSGEDDDNDDNSNKHYRGKKTSSSAGGAGGGSGAGVGAGRNRTVKRNGAAAMGPSRSVSAARAADASAGDAGGWLIAQ